MTGAGSRLPIVLVPVGTDEQALDDCLGALEASTPAGTRVWLADDAQGGPRVRAVVDAWLATTRMHAEYGRRPRSVGEAAHLARVLVACGDADVAVLAPDTRVTAGWLARLAACLAADPGAVTATPWCNAGETAAWPRLGEVSPMPVDPERIAEAALAAAEPPAVLPAAVDHAVLIRGTARRAVGGLDGETYRSRYAALIDLSLRMAGLGGRNLLCAQAYVVRPAEGRPGEGDMERIAVRWPHWNAALAGMLMADPLHPVRERIAATLGRLETGVAAQPGLFPQAGAP